MNSDADLLNAYVRDNSEPAFTELVNRHVDLVYSAALRQVGDSHRARDVSQIVFIALAREASVLASHPTLRGWLFTTTHHTAAKLLRSEHRRRIREQKAEIMSTTDRHTADTLDWERLRPVLDEVVHSLAARERHAVLLRFIDRKSTTEVGAALGLSESAARRLSDRALEKLRHLLGRRGITSTAAALGVLLSTQTISAAPAGLGDALSASAISKVAVSTAAPIPLALMTATKIQLALLAISVAFNLGLATSNATVEAPIPRVPARPRATAPREPPGNVMLEVPPALASQLVEGDLTDPAFVARKLSAEGYPQYVIVDAVRMAALDQRMPEYAAMVEQVVAKPTRWQPNPAKPDSVNAAWNRISEAAKTQADQILKETLGIEVSLPP